MSMMQMEKGMSTAEIVTLIEERVDARRHKDWDTADGIRDKLRSKGAKTSVARRIQISMNIFSIARRPSLRPRKKMGSARGWPQVSVFFISGRQSGCSGVAFSVLFNIYPEHVSGYGFLFCTCIRNRSSGSNGDFAILHTKNSPSLSPLRASCVSA